MYVYKFYGNKIGSASSDENGEREKMMETFLWTGDKDIMMKWEGSWDSLRQDTRSLVGDGGGKGEFLTLEIA